MIKRRKGFNINNSTAAGYIATGSKTAFRNDPKRRVRFLSGSQQSAGAN